MTDSIIRQFKAKPKNIFLLDSLGALVTALFLFAILRPLNEYIGMSQTTLTYLSLAAAIFCFYSAGCFFLLKNNWRPFLLIISIANLLYCLVTMTLVILSYQSLTFIGIAYFAGEIIVVCGLVFLELKILNTADDRVSK